MEKEWFSGKELADRWGLKDQELFDLIKATENIETKIIPQKGRHDWRGDWEQPKPKKETIITYALQPYYPTKDKCGFNNVKPTQEELKLLRESVKNMKAPWIYNVRWISDLCFKNDEVKKYEAEHPEILEIKRGKKHVDTLKRILLAHILTEYGLKPKQISELYKELKLPITVNDSSTGRDKTDGKKIFIEIQKIFCTGKVKE